MQNNKKEILRLVGEYLEKNPSVRFAQALFNLGINEFADKNNPEAKEFLLKDIYNDVDDDVLEKIKQTLSK